MAINRTHRLDLDSRVEQLAERLGLKGRERETAMSGRALAVLEQHIVHPRLDKTAIAASLDRYVVNGANLRKRLTARSDGSMPLSLSLQQALYDGRGLSR